MEKLINEIKTTNYEEKYLYLVNNNLSQEEMLIELSKNNPIINEFLIYKAASKKNIEMAKKIIEIMNIIYYQKLLEFKKAVVNGTYKEFLDKEDWRTKSDLYIKIHGLDLEEKENSGYPELKKYLNEIEKSAKADRHHEKFSIIADELIKLSQKYDQIIYPEYYREDIKLNHNKK